jgi:alkaline phosphatase D
VEARRQPGQISRLDVATLPAWLLGPLGKLLGIPSNGFAVNTDQWDGYNADRDELVNYLRAPSATSDNVNDFLHVPAGTVSPFGAALIRAANPHVKWAELDGHGYGVLDVRPDRCQMDWYHLVDRTRRDCGVRAVASWSVGTGSGHIRREAGPVT